MKVWVWVYYGKISWSECLRRVSWQNGPPLIVIATCRSLDGSVSVPQMKESKISTPICSLPNQLSVVLKPNQDQTVSHEHVRLSSYIFF